MAETIAKDVQEGVDEQRECPLRRQLDAVRKELCEINGEQEGESDDYRARVEAADLPEKVRAAALEVDKLGEWSRTSRPRVPGSAPGWTRSWNAVDRGGHRGRLRHPGRPGRCWTPSTRAWRT
ncbi:hypothetical protein STENM327S_05040 [Streptomyces tendae]